MGGRRTILLFPTSIEAAPLLRLRPDLDIRICGVGAVQCARFVARLLRTEMPDALILCGIAGAYDTRLNIGDTVAVEREREPGIPSRWAEEYCASELFAGAGLTPVISNTVAAAGAAAGGAAIENMEGAALFALCREAGVRCGEIRTVSNRVGDPPQMWDTAGAAGRLAGILMKIF